MAGFSVSGRYTTFRICQNVPWQSAEYISSSKYARILNKERIWKCKSYKRFKICYNMSKFMWIGREYPWIYREVSECYTIHSEVTLQVNGYFLQNTLSWIIERFLHVSGFKYVRIVDMPRFWISRVKQGLQIFVNKTGFCICAGMQLWKDSEYFKIPNMPGFSIYKRYATFWVCLIMSE